MQNCKNILRAETFKFCSTYTRSVQYFSATVLCCVNCFSWRCTKMFRTYKPKTFSFVTHIYDQCNILCCINIFRSLHKIFFTKICLGSRKNLAPKHFLLKNFPATQPLFPTQTFYGHCINIFQRICFSKPKNCLKHFPAMQPFLAPPNCPAVAPNIFPTNFFTTPENVSFVLYIHDTCNTFIQPLLSGRCVNNVKRVAQNNSQPLRIILRNQTKIIFEILIQHLN